MTSGKVKEHYKLANKLKLQIRRLVNLVGHNIWSFCLLFKGFKVCNNMWWYKSEKKENS